MIVEQVKFSELGDSTLQAAIEIKTTPDKVYAAWTKQEQFVKWFGPRVDGSLEVDTFDCSVGGRYDVTMVFADGDRVQLLGDFQELDPPNKLVFTWQWKEGPTAAAAPTLVTVDIMPSKIGTLLTLTHERFISTQSRNDHQQGWGPLLERLAKVLAN